MTADDRSHPVEVYLPGLTDRRVRIFRAEHEVDTSVLVTERYVVLVDTMATPELAEGIVESVRPELVGRQFLVINTHADYDHAWGNALFAAPDGRYPAPIIGRQGVYDRLRSDEDLQSLRRRQAAETRFASVRLVPPTITFTDGLRIDGGDLTISLIPTPGHTDDHVSVWIPELRLVLAGDAAERPIPYVNRPTDLPRLRDSIRRLAALDPAMVIPCHGGTTDPALLSANLMYLDKVEASARAAIAGGGLPPDWTVRDDLPAIIAMPYDAVAPPGEDTLDAVDSAFYQQSHLRAVRATLINLFAALA